MNDLTPLPQLRDRRKLGKGLYKSLADAKKVATWLVGVATRAMGESSSNTAGGFLAPDVLLQAIADVRDRVGVARSIMQVVPMTSDTGRVVKRAGSGVAGYYVDENAALTEAQASWDQITLTAKKIAALVRVSTELADDAVAFAEFVTVELAFSLEAMVDTAAFAGDGTSTYKGRLAKRHAEHVRRIHSGDLGQRHLGGVHERRHGKRRGCAAKRVSRPGNVALPPHRLWADDVQACRHRRWTADHRGQRQDHASLHGLPGGAVLGHAGWDRRHGPEQPCVVRVRRFQPGWDAGRPPQRRERVQLGPTLFGIRSDGLAGHGAV